MSIVDAHGHQYTTAAQELRTRELTSELLMFVQKRIQEGVARYRPGQQFTVDLQGAEEFINRAYFMGRQDG